MRNIIFVLLNAPLISTLHQTVDKANVIQIIVDSSMYLKLISLLSTISESTITVPIVLTFFQIFRLFRMGL